MAYAELERYDARGEFGVVGHLPADFRERMIAAVNAKIEMAERSETGIPALVSMTGFVVLKSKQVADSTWVPFIPGDLHSLASTI